MLSQLFRILIFSFGFLVGGQLPAFLDIYRQHAETHLKEAQIDFSGFQKIANHYFSGNVEKLIAHHLKSQDSVFIDEGKVIDTIWKRTLYFQKEVNALDNVLPIQAFHVLVLGDKELWNETLHHYSFALTFTRSTLLVGGIAGLLFVLIVEGILTLLFRRKGRLV
jgi:hypothetical protein